MRISMEAKGLPGSGGRPRPSLKWQAEQERALKSGPSPSRVATEPGASIQFWLKYELPTKNARRLTSLSDLKGILKASWVASTTVVSPPLSEVCGMRDVLAQPSANADAP